MSSRKPASEAIMARALSFTDEGAWPSAQFIEHRPRNCWPPCATKGSEKSHSLSSGKDGSLEGGSELGKVGRAPLCELDRRQWHALLSRHLLEQTAGLLLLRLSLGRERKDRGLPH
jgi:hypothetical protein